MYGLVNKAIHDMICTHHGPETWEIIKHKAEVEADSFISMEAYPDEINQRLVKAASAVLAKTP